MISIGLNDHSGMWVPVLLLGSLFLGAATGEKSQEAKRTPLPALPQPGALWVSSPLEYQVFQRRSRTKGTIRFSGKVGPGRRVEVRITGKPREGELDGAWIPLRVDPVSHAFNEAIALPAGGWYRVEIRAFSGGQATELITLDHVGIGEVFIGAGQSNSTSYGKVRTQPHTGMVSSFSGRGWKVADDPQDGSHDENWHKARGGSFWPSFGDALYEHYQVPIGVAVTGNGGTTVESWLPEKGAHFDHSMNRIGQLGRFGFRALLWHQGESDAATPSDDYASALAHVILTSWRRSGWVFPWFVAQTSYNHPGAPFSPLPRAGQKMVWDMGLALPGPDTDTLTGVHREAEGAHLSPAGLKAHGEMWARQVEAWLDPLLLRGETPPGTGHPDHEEE